MLAVPAAVINGVGSHVLGDTAYQYALSGTNIMLVVFIHIVHLQHAHMWISFGGAVGRNQPRASPGHHSTNPVHFNKNLGSCLAVQDWLSASSRPTPTRATSPANSFRRSAAASTSTVAIVNPARRCG